MDESAGQEFLEASVWTPGYGPRDVSAWATVHREPGYVWVEFDDSVVVGAGEMLVTNLPGFRIPE